VVDLDATNTGYGVGEVETVVEDASDIAEAKERVQSLISRITRNKIMTMDLLLESWSITLSRIDLNTIKRASKSGVIKTKY
jgi:hypothetical protein